METVLTAPAVAMAPSRYRRGPVMGIDPAVAIGPVMAIDPTDQEAVMAPSRCPNVLETGTDPIDPATGTDPTDQEAVMAPSRCLSDPAMATGPIALGTAIARIDPATETVLIAPTDRSSCLSTATTGLVNARPATARRPTVRVVPYGLPTTVADTGTTPTGTGAGTTTTATGGLPRPPAPSQAG